MAAPGLRILYRAAGWLAVAYFAAFAVPGAISEIREGVPGMVLVVIPVAFMMAIPIIAAAALVGASSTRIGATAFLLLELSLCASTVGFFWYYRDDGVVFSLPLWPIAQGAAICLVFMVALAFGWRIRPDFMKD